MKALRIICTKCGKERRITSEEGNLSSYQEEIVYEKCPHHIATPEDKLLAAIFGQKDRQ